MADRSDGRALQVRQMAGAKTAMVARTPGEASGYGPGGTVTNTEVKRCRSCGYVTLARPLDEDELWHYATTGESRHGGCPLHPWGWHYWTTDAQPPSRYYRDRRKRIIAAVDRQVFRWR